jgi:hypothetical protein
MNQNRGPRAGALSPPNKIHPSMGQGNFSIFEAEVRPSALKILESCRIKVVPNECPQLLRLIKLLLIFAYFDFTPLYFLCLWPV